MKAILEVLRILLCGVPVGLLVMTVFYFAQLHKTVHDDFPMAVGFPLGGLLGMLLAFRTRGRLQIDKYMVCIGTLLAIVFGLLLYIEFNNQDRYQGLQGIEWLVKVAASGSYAIGALCLAAVGVCGLPSRKLE